jgi:1-acyl-sn-glycerol-3-phosphate acyltransferase
MSLIQGRTLYFAGYVLTLIFVVLFLILIGWAMPYERRMRVASLWPRFMATSWLRWATGVKIEVIGGDKLPNKPFVAVCNHQSEWETLFLASLLCPSAIVMKEALLRIPVYGWGQRCLKPIAIDRGSPRAAIRAIVSQGTTRLEEGINVLIFPEGTRVNADEIKKYARTAFKLASENQVPLVPIVHNSGVYWRKKKFVRGTIKIVVGDALDTNASQSADQMTTEVERWSRETLAAMQGH